MEIEFELWEGMFHCWQVFAGELMEGEGCNQVHRQLYQEDDLLISVHFNEIIHVG